MFKRANKVTALLVAAASIMSIVPAMATTRLGVKDGHIKDGAIAFADGKYVYDGYRTDDNDNGIYYNNGTDAKEKLNDDLRDYELAGRYGEKYIYATDNNEKDQYLVDLTNGKVMDYAPEDKADSIKSTLKSALKKTDRYANTGSWDTISLGDSAESENYDQNTRVLPDRFGEVWYKYTAAGDTTTQQNRASFTVTLPTTNVATTIGGQLFPAAVDLTTLKANILAYIKADPAVTAVFDQNLIIISGDLTTIKGYAKNVGEISKIDTALVAFAAKYNVTLTGNSEVQSIVRNAVNLNLGTLASATSNNKDLVLARITTSSAVEVLSAGLSKSGNTTVDIKDVDGHAATLSVAVTTTGGISITDTKKYWTATQKNDAFNLIANTGTLLAALNATDDQALSVAFETLDLTAFVGQNKLTPKEAGYAVYDYLLTGSKGAYTLDTDTLKTVLQNALNKKLALNNNKTVTVDRGAYSAQYMGYVSESGKYIDVSNVANIYVYSKTEGKTVKIKEYSKENVDYHMTVSLRGIKEISQDKDYIYTLTTVDVDEDNYGTTTQYFIQKISKAQGEKKDGAYIPKSVDSYQVDNKTIYDDGDSNVVYNFLVSADQTEDGFKFANVTVKDGKLYITGTKTDKVKVFEVSLKKAKKDLSTGVPIGRKDGKDVDVYIADKTADQDHDLKNAKVSGTVNEGIAYDVNGNTWIINKGTISKFDGTSVKDMYTTDRSFTHLNVYDDKNLIAWDADSDVYTNVGEGTKVTQDDSTAVAPVVVTGWVKGTDGTWTYNDATGAKVVSKWQNLGGVWYFLKADGIMATGWFQDGGSTWYYADGSGAMKTGWIQDGANWYYLAGSGAMLANTTVDGYVLGASGAWVK